MRYTWTPTTAATQADSQSASRAWKWLATTAIVLGAFTIRIWTIRGGLPYVGHPDEPNPINYVLQMLQTGDLNPHAFQKPSLYIYLLLAVLAVHYRWGLATGLYTGLDQMVITTHQYTTIPGFFIWGRMLTVIAGSLTVLAVFALGKQIWSRSAGWIAALFLATAPFHMRHSQYVTTDVTSGLLIALTMVAAVKIVQGGRWRDYILAGAGVGLAASTKYNAGVIALGVLVAHTLYWGRQAFVRAPRLIGAGGMALIGFVIGTPYAVLSWPEFRQGLLGQVKDYTTGVHGDLVGAWNVRGYAQFFWTEGLGPLACIGVLAGLALLLWRQRKIGVLWFSFVVPYLLLHLAQSSHFMRNLVTVVVLCTLPIGVAGAYVITWLASRTARYRILASTVTLVLLLLPSTVATLRYSARMQRGDTRVQALRWIDANVPPGTRIAAELSPLPGPGDSRWAETPALLQHDMAWYRRQGYTYLIASSDSWKQWTLPESYNRYAGRPPLIDFGGVDSREMLGPHIVVYPTGLAPSDTPEPASAAIKMGGAHFLGISIGQPEPEAPQLGVRPTRVFQAGGVLGLRTFWKVEELFQADYFIFVHVLDSNGRIVAQRDAPPWQGRFPTSSWQSGALVVDVNDLTLPPGLPPGEYAVVVGMFDPASGAHPATQVNGQPQAVDAIPVGTIAIER
jgi:4-amino-4-deoxy-L-arabinose transferase-like glycosyltransferase